MIPPLTVKDIMTSDVVVTSPDAGLHEALNLLLDRKISGLPVVDHSGALVGILTERDCLRVAFDNDYYQGPGQRVRDAMTTEVKTVSADADIMTLIDLFLNHTFRRVPVVKDGAMVGLVSRRDALRTIRLI